MDIEASREAFRSLQVNEHVCYKDLPIRAKSGNLVDVRFVSIVYLVGDERIIQCNIRVRDTMDRKQAEEPAAPTRTARPRPYDRFIQPALFGKAEKRPVACVST